MSKAGDTEVFREYFKTIGLIERSAKNAPFLSLSKPVPFVVPPSANTRIGINYPLVSISSYLS
jgi:hypothetical protein